MNHLTIVGNVTANAEVKEVLVKNVKTKVARFTIAVNERHPDRTTYFKCHAWRELAETCGKYLTKGRKILVTGPVHLNSYETTSGAYRTDLDVRVENLEFLDKKPKEAQEEVEQEPEIDTEVPEFLDFEDLIPG